MSTSEMCLPYQIIHHNHDLASHTLMCQALPPLIVGVKGDMYNITHGQSDNESVVQSCQRMSTGTLGLPQDPHDAWQKVHMGFPQTDPLSHSPYCHPTCLSQWVHMGFMDYRTVGQSVGIPRVHTGTVGWDGQVG